MSSTSTDPPTPEGPGSVSGAPSTPPGLDAFTSLMPDGRLELREGYAEVGDVRLHYVEAGDGPLIVLLHGFPEFWFGWRLQIEPLVAAGFRVVAPDTRMPAVGRTADRDDDHVPMPWLSVRRRHGGRDRRPSD